MSLIEILISTVLFAAISGAVMRWLGASNYSIANVVVGSVIYFAVVALFSYVF